MKDLKVFFGLFIAMIFFNLGASVMDGTLDFDFNGSGLSAFVQVNSQFNAVAVQADDKIVAAGFAEFNGKKTFAVARYNSDGTFDESFGSQGRVVTRFGASETSSAAHALLIQDDGKILAAGFTNAVKNSERWCLVRYNPDGSLDTSFFSGRAIIPGTVVSFMAGDDSSRAHALAFDTHGKIIVAGSSKKGGKTYFSVARYNDNGSLDTSFNPEGKDAAPGIVRTSFAAVSNDDRAYAIALQPDQKIIVAGYSMASGVKTFALARYNPDGSLDKSFFSPKFSRIPGTVITNFACGETEGVAKALVIQPDGKIVAAGFSNSNAWSKDLTRFALARYDGRGVLDENFGGHGLATVPGTVLSSFGEQEGASRANALVLQSDGKVVAGGFVSLYGKSYFALARYNYDGKIDPEFNDGYSAAGKVITAIGERKANEVFGLAIQHNGDLIAAGVTDTNGILQGLLARYLTNDILLDPAITSPTDQTRIVDGSALQLRGVAQNPAVLKIYVDGALSGTTSVNGTSHTWAYTLAPLASGEHSIKVVAQYPGGKLNLVSESILITVDQHPKAVNATVTTCGLNPVEGLLTATGASGKYNFAILSTENGTVTLSDTHFVFTPNIVAGVGSFDFQVTDLFTGCTSVGTIIININEIPGLQSSEWQTCQSADCKGDLSQNVVGGVPPFTFELARQSDHGTVELSQDGTFKFNPVNDFNGVTTFEYYVTDAQGCISERQTASITVHELPRARDVLFTTHELEAVTENLLPYVSGGTPPYRFTLTGCPENAAITLQECGKFKLIPMRGFSGIARCCYTVTDAHNATSHPAHISIKVFELPVAQDQVHTISENSVLTHSLASAVHKGSAPYTFEVVGSAEHGIVQLQSDGSYRFTPDEDFSGTAAFRYRVTDANSGLSNEATVAIKVNELPKVLGDAVTTCQDNILEGNLRGLVNAGAPPYSFELVNQATHAHVTLNSDGSYTIVPHEGFSGVTSFHYKVVDSVGTASLAASITVTVHEAPLAQIAQYETSNVRPVCGNLASLVAKGTPPYTYEIESVDHGIVEATQEGSFIYTLDSEYVGLAGFNYRCVDAYLCKSNLARVSVHVHSAPKISDATYSIFEGVTLQASLESHAQGGIPPYRFELADDALNGTVTLEADGHFTFIPEIVNGRASFAYKISDSQGTMSNAGSVHIDILELPKLKPVQLQTVQDKQISFTIADAAFSGMPPYVFSLVNESHEGTVHLNGDGTGTFQPASGMIQNAYFEFSVTDARGGMSVVPGHADVLVHPPLKIENETSLEVNEDSQVTTDLGPSVSGSLAPYAFALVSEPSHGAAAITAAGHVLYTPHTGYSGSDEFDYCVADALGLSRLTSTVNVSINAKPRTSNCEYTTIQNSSLQGSLQHLVSQGLPPYTFASHEDIHNGSLVLNSDGTFIFTPDEGFFGLADFKYSATDARNLAGSPSIVTVRVYELPHAQSTQRFTVANHTVCDSLQSLVTHGQPPYTFKDAQNSLNGTVGIEADGTYTFKPDTNYVGQASFEYEVTDVHQATATGRVEIDIHEPLILQDPGDLSTCQGVPMSVELMPLVSGGFAPYVFTPINTETVTLSADGTLTYQASQGAYGIHTVEVCAHDSLSHAVSGVIKITVYDAPQAHDKTLTVCEYTVAKDQLNDAVSGGKPEYIFQQVGEAVNGTVKVNADGSYSLVIVPGSDEAQFSYCVIDSNGCLSNIARVIITVNKSPIANGTTLVAEQNGEYKGNLDGLVTGGTTPYSYTVVGSANHGVVSLESDGSFVFVPESDFTGTASFSYTANDAHECTSNIATITMVINPINRFYPQHLIKRYVNIGAR